MLEQPEEYKNASIVLKSEFEKLKALRASWEGSWKEIDDRQVQCSVIDESAMKVTGSAKGSRR